MEYLKKMNSKEQLWKQTNLETNSCGRQYSKQQKGEVTSTGNKIL